MLGQLGSLRRRCQRLTQGFALRGITTQHSVPHGTVTEKQGRRQQASPTPPPGPPEKIEWWAVDGELFKAEKFDVKQVLAPLQNEHISNKRRRRQLIKHLSQTRLHMKLHNQDSYWAAYMRRFQILRDEWEKHVWDPIPVPQPKRRQAAWLAEETQKYVWQDPRREAYLSGFASKNAANSYTFDVSRMDQSAVKARFDEKIGYRGQSMGNSPYENRRHPGASNIRPGMVPLRQRNMDSRRNLRQPDFEEFEDVFAESDTEGTNAFAEAPRSTRNQGDFEGKLFNWSDTDSDETSGYEAAARNEDEIVDWAKTDSEEQEGDEDEAGGKDDDDDDDDNEYNYEGGNNGDGVDREGDNQQKRRGWHGHEDDLFKDDD